MRHNLRAYTPMSLSSSSQSNVSQIASTNKQITILGAGAIGQLIYHQLQSVPSLYKLNLIGREDNSSTLPLAFTGMNGQINNRDALLIGANDCPKMLANTALLIVCVKAYQVKSALEAVINDLPYDAHILMLHNGMGPHIEIESILNGRGLSLGTTSQAALKLSTYHVQQTGTGLTQIGPFTAPALDHQIQNTLLKAITNSEWHQDILPLLWQKLAVNVAINPLTAINNCTNGELNDKKYRDVIYNAVNELVMVAKADGISLTLENLLERVYQVIKLTANNLSSMHQDVYHQRATEINAINGFVVARGKALRINTPYNQQLLKQVQQIEAKYQPASL
ncbi:2-dehydropantoate 2-reductase [Shewanella marinintestina]|uniref:ketopantoate reductase family protein n=1 Tax=Shewanella marinintestina TaxID=190305 RepID=UPI00200F84BA|nr:2-dehydropantoate 2-reductase [Shewanella marinintestina]MCL1146142.1 2-dehydropantoate 2-reductase [Shewanella marinintestina]